MTTQLGAIFNFLSFLYNICHSPNDNINFILNQNHMSNSNLTNNDLNTNENDRKEKMQENICEIQENIIIEMNINSDVKEMETDTSDKLGEKDVTDLSLIKTDTIVNIVDDHNRTVPPQNVGNIVREKQRVWVYSQYFTKHLWQQGQRRQQLQQVQLPHQQQPKPQEMWTQYSEGHNYSGSGFEGEPLMYDPETRNNFVRLVMMITLVMLLATALAIAYVLNTPDLRRFFLKNGMALMMLAFVVYLIPNYSMVCFPMARQPPCSIFMLLLATISMTTLAVVISCVYGTVIVLYATISTTAIVFVCLILACTSFDFTKWFLYLVVIAVGLTVVSLIVFGVSMVSGQQMTPIRIGILIISVILQSVFLVMELQMILGGRSLELAEDDYSLGAFMLYTSIVDIFIKMVQILGLTGSG